MQKSIRPIPQTIAQCTQPNTNTRMLRKYINIILNSSLVILGLGIGFTALASIGWLFAEQFLAFFCAIALIVIQIFGIIQSLMCSYALSAFADLVEDQRICANLLLYHEGQANIERYQRAKEKQEGLQ